MFDWIIGSAMPDLLGREPLHHLQLFLCNGDPKIYRLFDKHNETMMPHAKNALCIFHFIEKGLERLNPEIRGKDQIEVRNQKKIFKNWCYSSMQFGGVETMEEYHDSRKLLQTWLKEQSQLDDTNLSKNAIMYKTFLVKTLENQMDCVLFPKKCHIMSLGHHTTLPLEGQNSILKKKTSKTVKLNMTLFESAKTQTVISQNSCSLSDRKLGRLYGATSLWAQSTTVNSVNMFAKSQLQQNCVESGNYQCRICSIVDNTKVERNDNDVGCHKIQMVHCKSLEPYCTHCNANNICVACCDESALARYKRRLSIRFDPCPHTGMIAVTCYCLYTQVFGIPCQHICALLNTQPHHLFICWLKPYFTFYGHGSTPAKMNYFNTKQHDKRILITLPEYDFMMMLAWIIEE